MIKFKSIVHVASGVIFIYRDVSVFMLHNMKSEIEIRARTDEITIGHNIIGLNNVLLYGVYSGNNVDVGAGSIVKKDIPDGVAVVGAICKPNERKIQ